MTKDRDMNNVEVEKDNNSNKHEHDYYYIKDVVIAYMDTESAIFSCKKANLADSILASLKSVMANIYSIISSDDNSFVLAHMIYNTDMYFHDISKYVDIYISGDTVDKASPDFVKKILNVLKEYEIKDFAIDLSSFGEYLGKFLNAGYVVDRVSATNDRVLFLKKKDN